MLLGGFEFCRLLQQQQALHSGLEGAKHDAFLALGDALLRLLHPLLVHGFRLVEDRCGVLQVLQDFLVRLLEGAEHLLDLKEGVEDRGVDTLLLLAHKFYQLVDEKRSEQLLVLLC